MFLPLVGDLLRVLVAWQNVLPSIERDGEEERYPFADPLCYSDSDDELNSRPAAKEEPLPQKKENKKQPKAGLCNRSYERLKTNRSLSTNVQPLLNCIMH